MIDLRPVLCASLLLSAGCSDLWPSEMDQQPSVQPLMAPRPAPEGSVPVGGVEHLEDREDDADLTSPLGNDPSVVARGKQLFGIQCSMCHGDDGHGNGRLSKVFPPAPDLRYRTVCRRTDGFIYGTITAGGRAMPSMREGLTARDRWSLVAYVREIQREGCVGRPAEPEGDTP